jgi:hypothetical protein
MNDLNKSILKQEMSTDLLVKYLQEEHAAISITTNDSLKKENVTVPPRFQLVNRFPVSLWSTAQMYFST